MLAIRVVEDELMPTGHDWVRLHYDDGRVITVMSKSYVDMHAPTHPKRVLRLVS